MQQEYIYQEFPKWVTGVNGAGVEAPVIVQDAAEEAEQVERLEILRKAVVDAAEAGAKASRKAKAKEAQEVIRGLQADAAEAGAPQE